MTKQSDFGLDSVKRYRYNPHDINKSLALARCSSIVLFYVQVRISKAQYAQVAQLVEQWTENPRVGGSNPPLGTTYLMPYDN